MTNFFCNNGCGTTYKLHLANGKWTETVLHRFTGKGTDGQSPTGGLAFDKAGNLWGTTFIGGVGKSSTCGDTNGAGFCGTVFELTPNANGTWTESTLYSFVDASTGWNSFSGLILDQAGDLVGTTENGGSALQGTVFKITPKGEGKVEESLIHEFVGEADGAFPNSGLTLGAAGTLYGVVSQGGGIGGENICTEDSDESCGIVYKLTPGSDGTFDGDDSVYLQGWGRRSGACRRRACLRRQWRRLWLGIGRWRLQLQPNRLPRQPPRWMRRCIQGETVTASGAWRSEVARSLVSVRGSAYL